MEHNDSCERVGKWFKLAECREFSTDGTALGADIAHTMGTMDEDEIVNTPIERDQELTGMDEEQAEWDAED